MDLLVILVRFLRFGGVSIMLDKNIMSPTYMDMGKSHRLAITHNTTDLLHRKPYSCHPYLRQKIQAHFQSPLPSIGYFELFYAVNMVL